MCGNSSAPRRFRAPFTCSSGASSGSPAAAATGSSTSRTRQRGRSASTAAASDRRSTQVAPLGTQTTADGVVQIYPCYAFEAHVVYVEIDPETAQPSLRSYVCGHDCGVMINPDIVHGMTYGGIAHGIGAALYEKFSYTADGQLMRPDNYREWIFLSSGLGMTYSTPDAAASASTNCMPAPFN